jgi:hypothetical protein
VRDPLLVFHRNILAHLGFSLVQRGSMFNPLPYTDCYQKVTILLEVEYFECFGVDVITQDRVEYFECFGVDVITQDRVEYFEMLWYGCHNARYS